MNKHSLPRSMLAIVAVFVFVCQSPAVGQDWPMFHHDPALNGVANSLAPSAPVEWWTYNIGSPLHSSPVVADGRLFIGGTDNYVYAFDAETGAQLWTFRTWGAIYASPAVADGKVYILSTDTTLYALDAATGMALWMMGPVGGPTPWSSPAVHNGRVYVAASNGWVVCVDGATGAQVWRQYVGGNPNGPIAVANGNVYSGTNNATTSSPTLVALDEATGAVVWTYDHHALHGPTVGAIESSGVAVADGDGDGDLEVYFGIVTYGGTGNEAIALDEATGAEVWTQHLNGPSTSTPAVHGGKVYIGSDDGNVYALDAGTGAYVWAFQTGDMVWAASAVADGMVLVGSLDPTFYAIDENTGGLVWSYSTGSNRMMGSPAVADGRVYFGDENGTVYAIGQDDTIKTLEVAIDIKPGGNPNSINLKKKGVLPVAVLTTADFDALDVDPATVRLGDPALSGTASPVKSNHGDADNDGDVDLLLFFKVPQLVANGALDENSTEALLTGETYTGVTVVGSDSVRIVPPKAFEQTGTPFECPASAAGTASPGGPSSDMTLLAMAALTLAVAAAGCRRWNWRVAPRRN